MSASEAKIDIFCLINVTRYHFLSDCVPPSKATLLINSLIPGY